LKNTGYKSSEREREREREWGRGRGGGTGERWTGTAGISEEEKNAVNISQIYFKRVFEACTLDFFRLTYKIRQPADFSAANS